MYFVGLKILLGGFSVSETWKVTISHSLILILDILTDIPWKKKKGVTTAFQGQWTINPVDTISEKVSRICLPNSHFFFLNYGYTLDYYLYFHLKSQHLTYKFQETFLNLESYFEYRLFLLAAWIKKKILFIVFICEILIMHALLDSHGSILNPINKNTWKNFQNCQTLYKYKLLLLLYLKTFQNTGQSWKETMVFASFTEY